MEEQDRDILRTVLSFIFPPLGVLWQVGIGFHFWVNLALTFIFPWIGGFLHALYVIWTVDKNDNM